MSANTYAFTRWFVKHKHFSKNIEHILQTSALSRLYSVNTCAADREPDRDFVLGTLNQEPMWRTYSENPAEGACPNTLIMAEDTSLFAVGEKGLINNKTVHSLECFLICWQKQRVILLSKKEEK